MSFRRISAWAIKNPVPPIVLFIGLLLAGLLSFSTMTITDNPDISFPTVIVNVAQPGAAPAEMEVQITQKIETAVRGVNGVSDIISRIDEGNSQTIVQFDIGVPTDRALNDVRNAVQQARANLPQGILEPQVSRLDIDGDSIGQFSVDSTVMSEEQLSWFVDNTITKRLLQVPGMAGVSRGGGVTREVRINLDPSKMQALGITADAVNQQLRALNTNATGGRMEIAGDEQAVRVLGNAPSAYALGQTQISLGGGRSAKISDFATVQDSYGEQRNIELLNGHQVLSFSLQKSKGSSDVSVYDEAKKAVAGLSKEYPQVHIKEIFSSVQYTKGQYSSALWSMVTGAALAVVVVFLFLRDWRATAISAIAIPLSAIPTFWIIKSFFGFNLNTMSLLALSMVSGVLVDDAIVEIENIVRHMRMGKSAYKAAIEAADEIGLAVLATTMAIAAVFIPVGFMPGIPGQYFKNFGFTVAAAVLVSLAVARLITPLIAAYTLKSKGELPHASGRLMDWYHAMITWTLDSHRADEMWAAREKTHSGTARYIVLPFVCFTLFGLLFAPVGFIGALDFSEWGKLGWSLLAAFWVLIKFPLECAAIGLALSVLIWVINLLFMLLKGNTLAVNVSQLGACLKDNIYWLRTRAYDNRIKMICLGAGTAFLCTILMGKLEGSHFQLNPTINFDYSRVNIKMVPGTTREQTEKVSNALAAKLRHDPMVEWTQEDVNPGDASIFIGLKKDRSITSNAWERSIAPSLTKVADAQVNIRSLGGFGGSSGRDLSWLLVGDDPVLLQNTAQRLVGEMKALNVLVDPRIDADLERPEILIKPNFALAAQMGISTDALSNVIRVATLGEIDQGAAKFSLGDRQVPIRVTFGLDSRRSLAAIQNLPVPMASGGSVPLRTVADISLGSGLTTIRRYNLSRRLVIGADIAPGKVAGEAQKAVKSLPLWNKLPDGIHHADDFNDRWQNELVVNAGIALLTGVFLVFAVLILLYRRMLSPFVNVFSLMLAPLGSLVLLYVLNFPISMPVMIGIILLIGIVAKNSILLVDFALDEIDKGVPRRQAIIEAGHKRAQPILMTTVAMVMGMIPTALSLSGDGAWRQPMGITVIGGLTLSTLLTLVIIPALFSVALDVEAWMGPRLARNILTFKAEDADEAQL
jgi:multidrug efflux pump subunit AcrB